MKRTVVPIKSCVGAFPQSIDSIGIRDEVPVGKSMSESLQRV